MNVILQKMPTDLLIGHDRRRAAQRLRWCETRNIRPTFAQLEDERRRRRGGRR